MKVIKSNILIEEPLVEEKISAGGIIVSKSKPNFREPLKGKVVSVGEEVKEVKVGDEVMYMPTSGESIKREDCTWHILSEDEILVVL